VLHAPSFNTMSLWSWLKQKSKLGRPPKPTNLGRPPNTRKGSDSLSAAGGGSGVGIGSSNSTDPQLLRPDAASVQPPKATTAQKSRASFSGGDNLTKMEAALDEWNDGADARYSLRTFCKLKGLGRAAFTNRLNGKVAVDASAGRPPLIHNKDAQVVVDTLRRFDRGNAGGGVSKAIDLVKELKPSVTHKQARDKALQIRKKNSDVLTAPTKAQPTTSKRSQVTLGGQFRWHQVHLLLASHLALTASFHTTILRPHS